MTQTSSKVAFVTGASGGILALDGRRLNIADRAERKERKTS